MTNAIGNSWHAGQHVLVNTTAGTQLPGVIRKLGDDGVLVWTDYESLIYTPWTSVDTMELFSDESGSDSERE